MFKTINIMKNRIATILIFLFHFSHFWGQDWKPEDKYEKLFFINDFAKNQNLKTIKIYSEH
ncbi:hypothetical protein L100_06782 [Elizabethkingia meningoseptica ATCC 13253 = NBRC 12535]|nr:hypothetical protein L100_06782 [Elizabethkingia meningoseptica ATCC 13253 = NBRC 12535]